jgi:S-formylglutathione hydrolase
LIGFISQTKIGKDEYPMQIITETALFGGRHVVVRHDSETCHCPMEFALFIPAGEGPFPCLLYLSGLTCTWENATTKAGAQAHAAKTGMALVFPDTSPRGADVADDEAFSLGQGAGYYMTATDAPWAPHYAMDTYVIDELPRLVSKHVDIDWGRLGVTGHSMGGHGALTLAMKHSDKFRSLSAFAPISALSQLPWGKIALDAYRGSDPESHTLYDAAAMMESHGWNNDILVDQGAADPFLKEHLRPDLLATAAENAKIKLQLRMHDGYDHSYWFVSTFMADHIDWHANRLK